MCGNLVNLISDSSKFCCSQKGRLWRVGEALYTGRPSIWNEFGRREFQIGGLCHKILNSCDGCSNVTKGRDKINGQNCNHTNF